MRAANAEQYIQEIGELGARLELEIVIITITLFSRHN